MDTTHEELTNQGRKWGLFGAILAAITASVCCVGPLVLLALGVSGAWIGNLTALEPYRPIFAVLAFGFLGFAFYRVYRKPKAEECEDGSYCANPRTDRINKTVLWIVTVAIVGLLAFPYVAPRVFAGATPADQTAKTAQVVLAVENMTCASCPLTVGSSLRQVPGVVDAQATLNPPQAIVSYDPTKATVDDLIAATTNAGYPSALTSELP